MLANVDNPIRKSTLAIINKLKGLGSVVFKGKTACSAYIKQQRVKYGFVGLAPSKSELRVIIRSDPSISDPKCWVSSELVNWFSSSEIKQEREFRITDESQVEYAFELVKQSYEIIRKREFSNNKID